MGLSSTALKLKRLGIETVPVYNSGAPVANIKDDPDFTEADMRQWSDQYNDDCSLAIRCGVNDVVALDVDCDHKWTAQALKRAVAEIFGDCPIRYRRGSTSFAVVLRHDGECAYNGHSASFHFEGAGRSQQIEYKAWHQFITVSGKHRTTGDRYLMRNPERLSIKLLPTATRAKLDQLFSIFESICGYRLWEQTGSRRFSADRRSLTCIAEGEPVTMETMSSVPKLRVGDAKLQRILNGTDGSYREGWLRMGMALHHQFSGKIEGLEMWDTWAQGFDGYVDFDDHAAQWESFRSNIPKPVTLRTIANEIEPKTEPFETEDDIADLEVDEDPLEAKYRALLKNHVFISSGSWVGCTSARADESVLSLQDFRNTYAHLVRRIETPQANGGTKHTKVRMVSEWLEDPDRKTVHSVQYIPRDTRIIRSDSGMKHYNNYVAPDVKRVSGRDRVGIFHAHMEYLFPDAGDRAWFLNWLAHMVQRPWERPTVHVLHISPYQRTGRGWLMSLMTKLVGKKNKAITNMALMSKEDGFSGFMDSTVLVELPETFVPAEGKFAVSDRLRTIFSEKEQFVNRKYGEDGTIPVYFRVMMMSNHLDALVLDEEDSRVSVFTNTKPRKEPAYYERLNNALDDREFINQVWSELHERKLVMSDIWNARVNQSKRDLIDSCRSETALAFFAFRDMVKTSSFSRDTLVLWMNTWLSTEFKGQLSSVNKKELPHLVRGYVHCIKRVPGVGELLSFDYKEDISSDVFELDATDEEM